MTKNDDSDTITTVETYETIEMGYGGDEDDGSGADILLILIGLLLLSTLADWYLATFGGL